MTESSATQFRRLLEILPRFASEETQSLTTLSGILGVPVSTLVRDFSALAERYDDPAGFVEGVAVGIDGDQVTVRTDHFHRPMRLTHAELCALELGLSLLARESSSDALLGLPGLRERLATLISILPQDRAYAGYRDGAFAVAGRNVLGTLRGALARSRVLHMTYQGAGRDTATERDVQPWRLVFSRGAWFLLGYCESSDAPRVFRSDRIVEATTLDRTCPRPDEASVQALLVDGLPFSSAAFQERCVVQYSPAIARWIAERDRGPLEPDGSAVRSRPLADREWAIRHVLQYGPDAEIISPLSLREEVLDRLRAMG